MFIEWCCPNRKDAQALCPPCACRIRESRSPSARRTLLSRSPSASRIMLCRNPSALTMAERFSPSAAGLPPTSGPLCCSLFGHRTLDCSDGSTSLISTRSTLTPHWSVSRSRISRTFVLGHHGRTGPHRLHIPIIPRRLVWARATVAIR